MSAEIFNANLNRFFECGSGAYSDVTDRESRVDSQITVTGPEAVIMERQFPAIETGSVTAVKESGRNPEKEFRLFPTGRTVRLNLVRPKPEKSELRLYLRTGVFRPEPGLIWFVFVRGKETWIGALGESEFTALEEGKNTSSAKPALLDPDDLSYQDAVQYDADDDNYTVLVSKIRRDPAVAKRALSESGYRCELTPGLPVFISRATGKPYLEVHHFVPLSLQPQFELKLDIAENLSILNPLTHRQLHHGKIGDIAPYISGMSGRRAAFLESLNLTENDLMEFYS